MPSLIPWAAEQPGVSYSACAENRPLTSLLYLCALSLRHAFDVKG